ncbi:hypothetical protein WMF30_29090 [Sorangium sp. So ce134]
MKTQQQTGSAGEGQPPGAASVTQILSAAEVDALVEGYARVPGSVASLAMKQVGGMFPPGATFFDTIAKSFFTHGDPPVPPLLPMDAKDRERCLIALLAARGLTLPLALHFYWGIAVGLSVDDIAVTLLLAGSYEGVSVYMNSLTVLKATLGALKDLFPKGEPRGKLAPVPPEAAISAVQRAFSP